MVNYWHIDWTTLLIGASNADVTMLLIVLPFWCVLNQDSSGGCDWRSELIAGEPNVYDILLLNTYTLYREAMSCEWADCSVYGKKFRNISLFGRHVQTHTGALNFACIWEGCSERWVWLTLGNFGLPLVTFGYFGILWVTLGYFGY